MQHNYRITYNEANTINLTKCYEAEQAILALVAFTLDNPNAFVTKVEEI